MLDPPTRWFDWLTWPLLVGAGVAATAVLLPHMSPTLLTVVHLSGLVAIVVVLEYLRPQRPRPPRTESLWRELGHVLLGLELGSALGYAAAVAVAGLAADARADAVWWPASLPVAVQVALALLVVDLANYVQHRTIHRVPALWPLHALHHQPRSLDVVKTGRFHVVDLSANIFVSHLPLLALGPSPAIVAWAATLNGLAGVLQHANLRMPTPAWLDGLVGTPAVHWHHHSATTDGNYASIYPLIDRALGTWVPTRGRRPARLGIIDDPLPSGFLAPLLAPFRRRGTGSWVLTTDDHSSSRWYRDKTQPDRTTTDIRCMTRKPRIVVADVPHNLCMRGNNRRRLFSSTGDRLFFLRCLERGLDDSGCILHQLTLMNNHVHAVAVPPSRDALSRFVARSCQRYAQLRNADRDASGKLFEERFFSEVIADEAAMMTTTMYNDANGYYGGIADTPFDHCWSTGPHHAGVAGSRIPPSLWTPSRWYRGLAAEPSDQARVYRELIVAYAARRDAAEQRDVPSLAQIDDRYTLRLERPDRSRAREISSRWPPKDEHDR